mgnify:CR=1 FL=1
MKSNYKYGIVFFVVYLILNFASSMLLYSWTAFGGRNNINFAQKAILFFFDFPSLNLGLKSIWLSLFINAIFWSIIFIIIVYLYNNIKNKKTAN